MSNYRVDFKLIRKNSRQNRKAFTFALADSEEEAADRVREGQAKNLETIEIISVTRLAG